MIFIMMMMQVFVFVTISKFGALNCALIGLGRKMLSLLLSFILYNHTMNAIQMVGLSLSLLAMIANFYEKVNINTQSLILEIFRLYVDFIFIIVTFSTYYLNFENFWIPIILHLTYLDCYLDCTITH